jgi:hypothetical protein
MKRFRKVGLGIIAVLLMVYLGSCSLLFFNQESVLFFPGTLAPDYVFQYDDDFDEIFVETADSVTLHGLLFHADSAQGLIFYLHGNAGGLDRWGGIAHNYTALGYDIFILDYRGYGKSEGSIHSEEQFFSDAQAAYDKLKSLYHEDRIVIIGYSIGTAAAAMLASNNNQRQLVLQAPYYSLVDMMRHTYPLLPTSILNYPFETYKYVSETSSPIAIFHGDQDEVIYYGSSEKLAGHLKPTDVFITLEGLGHNGINENPEYLDALNRILNQSVIP